MSMLFMVFGFHNCLLLKAPSTEPSCFRGGASSEEDLCIIYRSKERARFGHAILCCNVCGTTGSVVMEYIFIGMIGTKEENKQTENILSRKHQPVLTRKGSDLQRVHPTEMSKSALSSSSSSFHCF